MQRWSKLLGLLVVALATTACGKKENRFHNIEIKEPATIKVERFDQAVWALNECITQPAKVGNYDLMLVDIPDDDSVCLKKRIEELETQYGESFNLYLHQLGVNSGAIRENPTTLFYLFLTHPAYRELYENCQEKYPDMNDIEQQFSDAFSRAALLLKDFKTPEVYAFFSGFAEYIAADNERLYVSLEYFLGADFKNYQYVPGIYNYMIPNLRKEKLVPDAVYAWVCSEYPIEKETPTLLDQMLYCGKMMYIMESIFPNVDEKVLMGYNEEEWEWCEMNEKNMWRYMQEYNQLFSTNSKMISDYVNPANCTKYFSDENFQAPSRTGVWIGWQIIRCLMAEKDEITLPDLLSVEDSQHLLEQSRYRP